MGIKIEKISVKDCGPINEFNENLVGLNLIYSKNEKGKSFLVEFVIQCLFKNKNNWGYLREVGNGKVSIVGLENKSVEFMPNSRKKLEDYFEKDPKGLPQSLTKLLVVKEGETEIVKDETGIDKNTIKEILSSRRILDLIDNKISATVKEAKIKEDILDISKKGEGDKYDGMKNEFEKVEEKINKLNEAYEKGELKNLELQKEELKQKRDLLLKAKRYKAYRLSEDIKKLEKESNEIPESEIRKLEDLFKNYEKTKEKYDIVKRDFDDIRQKTAKLPELKNKYDILLKAKRYKAYKLAIELKKIEEELKKIPDDMLSEIKQNISKYRDKLNEQEEKNKKVNELGEKSKDYDWLKKAVENYNKFLSAPLMSGEEISLLPYFSFLVLGGGILSIIFDQKIFGIVLILLGAFVSGFYLIKLRKLVTTYKQSQEFNSIKEEFKKRFGTEFVDLTQLEAILKEQEKNSHNKEFYENELFQLNIEVKNLKRVIGESFERLNIGKIEESECDKKLLELNNERKELLNNSQRIREELAKLEIDESEYERNDPGVEFNKWELEKVENELAKLYDLKQQEIGKDNELKKLEENLNKLSREIKESFKTLIGREIAETEWKNKLEELEEERKKILKEIQRKQGELKGLGISENEYEIENPGKEFSQSELDKIDNELRELEEKIEAGNRKLLGLKSDLCSLLTGTDISVDWNGLIDKLYTKREELRKELEEIEAKLIAGIMVHQTIEELREEENKKLLEGLNSDDVTNFLFKMTERYKRLSFDENDVIISDDFYNFSLKDLSTAAKEQVMLALRIGFAKRILKQESAFLILDDAFQHSDYDKRPILVDTLFELVKNGWQVIYLTMDDHIRSLFNENRSKIEIDEFKEILL
ncbi:MAG: hypothetical protein NC904_05150 [Candidatus Omnitrophica bacterium]|nr:hypothetical protein [Candidatus Omnitrophota bacterium]